MELNIVFKNIFAKNISRRPFILMLIPLVLSSFTHLWNPIGFPDIFYDEGVYLGRAMHVLYGLGPQEVFPSKLPYYDHPYFGQIFLASIFKLVGYPDSVSSPSPISYKHSFELLYLVPRVLMGLLAVLDTLLIYKTAELRYGRNVALIASILFAVMPITWFTRRILLDSIQLPLILSSIFLAELYHHKKENSLSLSTKPIGNTLNKVGNKKDIALVFLSGIFLGLAIFTKIPALTMIPLVSFIIITCADYHNTNKNRSVRSNNNSKNNNRSINWRFLIIWLIPVILIPTIWPIQSLFLNHFNYWLDGIFHQTSRQDEGNPLYAINLLFMMDPVIFILGLAGLVFVGMKRDFFLVLWAIPYIIYLYFIGYVQYFHIIPLIPLLCISASRLIIDLPRKIAKKKKQVGLLLPIFVTSIIVIFGLTSTTMLITTNISSQFEAAAFAAEYLQGHSGKTDDNQDKITLASSPVYSWIFTYVFKYHPTFSGNGDFLSLPVETGKLLLISDSHFTDSMTDTQFKALTKNTDHIVNIKANHTGFSKYSYPYTSMAVNREGSEQEIRLSKPEYSACIRYNESNRLISVSCDSSSLSRIDQHLDDDKILHQEGHKVWFLNANLVIENTSNFYINSTDTSWLKINSTFTGDRDKDPNHIVARGNLIIDSVKITSWDTNKYGYPKSNGTIPRSYILVNYGNGTTNITNSELAYLGYQHARSFGLTYYTGADSIIKNNKIHGLWTGFYSDGFADGAYNIIIEGNDFYNNTGQGIDPHSGTHDMIIKNNTVYNNGRHGIICSVDCYNIIIHSNRVFNNTYGIQLNDNITNSIIKNNLLYDNKQDQIWLNNLANNNSVYANNITGGLNGIRVSGGSANNTINNNMIANSNSAAIYIHSAASYNTFISNTVNNSTNALFIVDQNTTKNTFRDNSLLNSKEEAIKLYRADNSTNKFENNTSYTEPIMRGSNLYAKLPTLSQMQNKHPPTECISYDSRDNTILISCGNANLTDVYNAISANSSGILSKGPDKVWLLNANIKVENNTNFYINSTDTSWLKINSTFTGDRDKDPNHILARGNMIIDSVKITSWDTNKNTYPKSNGTIPRSYILVNYGNGTTNITNSELAYLGYPHARSFGLTYYTGADSIIKNNKIHDLWTGFYSDGFADGAYNIIIEGNDFYNNTLYGIDPHSGTHDMIIKNNTVYNNGRHGIICSVDCYNIIIHSNRVFNNTYGIQLNDNITNSIIKNNLLYDNKQDQIWLNNLANNNSVYANNITGGLNGIRVSGGSANNTINNNMIANSNSAAIYIHSAASYNTFISNTVNNSTNALFIVDQNTTKNTFRDNSLLNSKEEAIKLYRADNSTNKFENNTSYTEPIMRGSNLYAKLPTLSQMQNKHPPTECISYDSRDNTILISCGNANLTDVYNAISANSSGILSKGPDKVWLLNANIKVENNTNFYINSTDTSWLKINSTFTGDRDKDPNHILARGNMIIDSVKITSWDTNKNTYPKSNGTIPRSYILVNYGNGTTNITNSELAYLGYPHARSFGLTYYTGADSIIKNNKIHDLWTGFYSDGFADGAYNIIIEGNDFYNNTLYGIDPHSGTHDMIIKNNTVYNNGRHGIICSVDCYNIIIHSNRVFNNTYGIQLNDNITNSIIKNNLLYDNKQDQIWLNNLANNNSVYANNITGGLNGIRVSGGSANNTINNNMIANSNSAAIYIHSAASYNTFISNTVNNSTNALFIVDQNTTKNTFRDNSLLNSKEEAIKLYRADNSTNKFENNTSYVEPIMTDRSFNAKLIFNGFEFPNDVSDLSPVSKFEFLGPNDILILEKNVGKVYRIVNSTLLKDPLLDVSVANEWDRGLLGIAVDSKNKPIQVYLYFTESKPSRDGADDCPTQFYCKEQSNITISDSIYKYDFINNKLVNPKLILALPAVPGPRHNGGDLIIGPDHNLYVTVGDIEGARSSSTRTMSMNYQNGTESDGRSGILRIILNGTSIGKGILGDYYPLNLYYAFGIRNSFGIDFDLVSGILWDTENGDHFGDEINLVKSGFNSGWKEIQGVWKISESDLFDYNPAPRYKGFNESTGGLSALDLDLSQFEGRGQYSAPEFVWNETVAPSAIKFLNSDIYGKKYLNDLLVGDFKFGNLYHFDLNKNRTELSLKGKLSDKIANNQNENEGILLGQRFGKITDVEVSPDGFLYILALNGDRASLFKLIPSG